MSNVIDLFPDPTDGDYEGHILPALVDVLADIWTTLDDDSKTISPIMAASIIRYAINSLTNLELMRRDGVFRDNRLPPDLGIAVDHFAADCAKSLGGDKEMVEKLRNRTPVRRKPNE